MLRVLLVVTLLLAAAPATAAVPRERCDSIDSLESIAKMAPGAERVLADQRVAPFEAPFAEGASIHCTGAYRGKYLLVFQEERGTRNGVEYWAHYWWGRAAFASTETGKMGTDPWLVSCERDAIDDEASCSLTSVASVLTIVVTMGELGPEYVIDVGPSDPYPGDPKAIRIDGEQAFVSEQGLPFLPPRSMLIVDRFRNPHRQVTTRYYSWPDRRERTGSSKAHGLAEALEYLDWVIRRVQ